MKIRHRGFTLNANEGFLPATGSAPMTADTSSRAVPPKVLVCDRLDAAGIQILQAAGLNVEERVGLSPEQLRKFAGDVEAILVRSATKIDVTMIQSCPRLRVIGRAGTGVDNIDLAAATRSGVLVMNTPEANATTTAELALAHIFALARHIPAADRSMRAGRWEKSDLVGTEITGKTLAVIGMGRIGRIVAQKALGIGMKVIAFDPYLTAKSPVPGVELVSWDEALEGADSISIHVPKNKDTVGMFDRTAFEMMKPTAFLINCSRGGIVVESDLVSALEQGEIAGAALDVFDVEPLPEDSPLRRVDRLVITPHLGASSGEAQRRVSVEICEQLVDYLCSGDPRGAVNAPALSIEALARLRPYLILARRLGLLLAQSTDEPLVRVEISYAGDLAREKTDSLRIAVMAGLLAPSLDRPVNEVNAPVIAAERGLKILEERTERGSGFTSLLDVKGFTAQGRSHRVSGTVFRNKPRLVRFDRFGVDFVPDGEMLLTKHRDAPGVLGLVATWLGERGVNIGGLHMGEADGEEDSALALYQINRALTADEEVELAELAPIISARSISLH